MNLSTTLHRAEDKSLEGTFSDLYVSSSNLFSLEVSLQLKVVLQSNYINSAEKWFSGFKCRVFDGPPGSAYAEFGGTKVLARV